MQCRLCNQTGELRNSHIIPEFFYKALYDANHRFYVIPTDSAKREEFEQKGLREKLLCDSCEQRFSRWESYANETFVQGNGLRIVPFDRGLVFQGLDYKKFKLLLMSVLWRMGVSSLDFFKQVSLGNVHEGRLGQALLNDDPLDELQYGCFFVGVYLNGKAYKDWIGQPTRLKVKGQHCYGVVINGILYGFFVSNQQVPAEFRGGVLRKNGEMVLLYEEMANIPFLWESALGVAEGIRLRRQ